MKNRYSSLKSILQSNEYNFRICMDGKRRFFTKIILCFVYCIIGVTISIACTSCISTKTFVQQQYQLEVANTASTKSKPSEKTLVINNVTIAPQFASLGFVYRTSELNYLVDYYNVFFTSPAQQINQIMIDYLRGENIFSYVANDVGLLKIDYVLSPQITALYADYRNTKKPLAIITIDCYLFSANKANKLLFHKAYTASVPLKSKSSESLIIAWNQGLRRILSDITVDLFVI